MSWDPAGDPSAWSVEAVWVLVVGMLVGGFIAGYWLIPRRIARDIERDLDAEQRNRA